MQLRIIFIIDWWMDMFFWLLKCLIFKISQNGEKCKIQFQGVIFKCLVPKKEIQITMIWNKEKWQIFKWRSWNQQLIDESSKLLLINSNQLIVSALHCNLNCYHFVTTFKWCRAIVCVVLTTVPNPQILCLLYVMHEVFSLFSPVPCWFSPSQARAR